MAKFDHENSYFYMLNDEEFVVEFDFTNNIASGDSLASIQSLTIKNTDGTDYSSTMITGSSVSSPDIIFTVVGSAAPTAGVYEISILAKTTNSKYHRGNITCEIFEGVTLNEQLADPSANSYVSLAEANEYIRNARGHATKWDTLSVEGRKRLLIQACRDIDTFNFIGKKYYDFQALEFPRNDHSVITGDVGTPITVNSFKNTGFTSDTYGSYKSNTNYWKYGTVHITAATPLGEIKQISANNITTDVITLASNFSATPTTNSDFIAFEPLDPKIKNAQCEHALHIIENEGGGTLQNYISIGARRVQIGDTEVDFGADSGKSMTRGVSSRSKQLLSEWIQRYRKLARA